MVVLSGYFNSRVGKCNDLIVNVYMTVLLKILFTLLPTQTTLRCPEKFKR